jgi:hypothetical protein
MHAELTAIAFRKVLHHMDGTRDSTVRYADFLRVYGGRVPVTSTPSTTSPTRRRSAPRNSTSTATAARTNGGGGGGGGGGGTGASTVSEKMSHRRGGDKPVGIDVKLSAPMAQVRLYHSQRLWFCSIALKKTLVCMFVRSYVSSFVSTLVSVCTVIPPLGPLHPHRATYVLTRATVYALSHPTRPPCART